MVTIKLGGGTKALASSALMKSTFRALLSVGITILVFCERVTASQSTEHGVIPTPIQGVGISEVVYNDLAFYAKYCAVSYSSVCPKPMGNILVKRVRDKVTGTDGMIVRDDKRKEIVVAFRGTSELTDAITGEIKCRLTVVLTSFHRRYSVHPCSSSFHWTRWHGQRKSSSWIPGRLQRCGLGCSTHSARSISSTPFIQDYCHGTFPRGCNCCSGSYFN